MFDYYSLFIVVVIKFVDFVKNFDDFYYVSVKNDIVVNLSVWEKLV